ETSESPIVTGCVRTNGSSCAKTSDTTKRYFGTEHGSEIEMTPGALNIKGGSKEPLSISFDDKVGVTIKSPKKLSLNADEEIIMKTPQSVKVKGESQILAAKTETQSGFSMETDMHFLSNNVIKEGTNRETYPPFNDEPIAGRKPAPPEPPKEEKEGFSWGKLAKGVLAGLAVVATVAVVAAAVVFTAGTAIPAVAGTAAVLSQAISDAGRKEVSDISSYMAAGCRESFIGAVSGAIFGPFGVGEALGGKMLLGGITNGFESILRQKLEGKGINFKTVLTDFGIGAGTAAVFHGAEKLIKKAAPFVKKAFNKISAEISENIRIAKIALNNMKKGPKPAVLGSNLGNGYEALGRFKKEVKKVKNELGSSVDDKAGSSVDNIGDGLGKNVDDVMDTDELEEYTNHWHEFRKENKGEYTKDELPEKYREYLKSKGITQKMGKLREQYLGSTPGKTSATGKKVIERMDKEKCIKKDLDGNVIQFKSKQDGEWYDISLADMSHRNDGEHMDAVTYWNKFGRYEGAKSKEVRD
ncbi:hypothetical protein OIO11_11805, partial [Clostridium sp. ZS2-4]|nr:hypothetical protein [Clostridium sp. ZS2-4]